MLFVGFVVEVALLALVAEVAALFAGPLVVAEVAKLSALMVAEVAALFAGPLVVSR